MEVINSTELHDVLCHKRELEFGGSCSTNGGEGERVYIIGGRLEVKRPLGRPKRRSVDNIKTNLGEIRRR
jgi:hypothetical protein